ncbi:MAG: hypothetical protein IJV08_04285 [Bacteroidaceae bacterium]|nr:hypothetical protein [Bacteroidaceae bacterium]
MTKRYFMMGLLLVAATIAKAQDTYMNDRLTATDDLHGSARYVGMGGALGALGADLSAISSNPAAIGLYRRSEIGLTFGAIVPNKANGWSKNDARTYGEGLAKASFDQMGFVWSLKTDNSVLKYMNFSVNYQKKANYNLGFYADNRNLGGLSQMDQIAELADAGYDTDYNLAGMAVDNSFLSKDEQGYYNAYRGQRSNYTRHQRGSLQAYDINMSFNLSDRFYTGFTVGLDNVNYKSWSEYQELSADKDGNYGDYSLYNDRDVDGHGVNVKFGFLVRPVADNPFRIGLAVETPTWYRMKSSVLYDLTDQAVNPTVRTKTLETYLETTVRTPWRVRLSMGSTVDKVLAWGVEYEYANMAKTRMGYPSYNDNDGYHSSFAHTNDQAMNRQTEAVLKGQHTVKVGLEVKPVDKVAIRVGYNFISKRYGDNPSFDQYNLDSRAMNFQTATDYMTLGATNIATFGIGYKYKKFYADLAYKYRAQSGKFYAFDTGYTDPNGQFAQDNPSLAGASLQPVDVPLNRHQVMMSLGFKF